MEIVPEYNLDVGPVVNEGLCIKIDMWDEWMNNKPAIWDILYRSFEIAKEGGAIKEAYVDLNYYGGPRTYYFPHKFYNSHPTIIKELQMAIKKALEEREELIGIAKRDKKILELQKEIDEISRIKLIVMGLED